MKRIRFTEEQIIAVLQEHEAGAKTADLARKHGVSAATLYNWKAKYGGLDVSEARRLKALEEETRKLKKLLAESMLDLVLQPSRTPFREPTRLKAVACAAIGGVTKKREIGAIGR